jgi:1-phosphofructokinase
MAASLGAEVCLSATLGGESGRVTKALIEHEDIRVRRVETAGANGVYVQDRRTGERVTVATMRPLPLTRHELDALYGVALVEGIEAGVCVLGGHDDPGVVPADTYARLAADLRANGATVVADLAGAALEAVLLGGVTVLKVSSEDLLRHGLATGDSPEQLVPVMERFAEGAANVVVSRAEKPALALLEGELLEVVPPGLHPIDHRGAGDSMTAGLAVGVARRDGLSGSVRLGAAAGALNVTRRGLGTGAREEIERLASHVVVRPLEPMG